MDSKWIYLLIITSNILHSMCLLLLTHNQCLKWNVCHVTVYIHTSTTRLPVRQRCTNSGPQVAPENKLFTWRPNICGSSVRSCFLSPLWHLEFSVAPRFTWKFVFNRPNGLFIIVVKMIYIYIYFTIHHWWRFKLN